MSTPESKIRRLGRDVELVKALEDRFGVVIADGRLKSIESVGDAVSLVKELDAEGTTASA